MESGRPSLAVGHLGPHGPGYGTGGVAVRFSDPAGTATELVPGTSGRSAVTFAATDGGGFTTSGFLPAEFQGSSFNTFEMAPDKMIRFLRYPDLSTDAQRALLDPQLPRRRHHGPPVDLVGLVLEPVQLDPADSESRRALAAVSTALP